jgi:predicted AAA+ superfamily ATPase
MEAKQIRNIEKAKIRKEIYQLERNLIIFDEIEALKNPKHFLEHAAR